jgi:AcrR family transcriptional regulator
LTILPFNMSDRSNRKRIIFEEAALLFMEKGYVGSSMRDLAERVGIEPSSLYSHIRSKEEILSKICLDTAAAFVNGMNEIESSLDNSIEQIEAIIDLHITIAKEDPSSMTVFSNEWKHLPEETRAIFEKQRRNYQKRFKAILTKGIAEGSLCDVDPSMAMKTILTSLRWIHFWTPADRKLDYDLAKKEIKKVILKGIQA